MVSDSIEVNQNIMVRGHSRGKLLMAAGKEVEKKGGRVRELGERGRGARDRI